MRYGTHWGNYATNSVPGSVPTTSATMAISSQRENALLLWNCRQYDIIYDVRCVLDTNVVVAAMRSPVGASAELLRMARRGEIPPLANVALALEYEATSLLSGLLN